MTTAAVDLSPFVAKGFPGPYDRAIAEVQVRGIDREQAHAMVRVCPETEAVLYEGNFSPTRIRYRRGSRPALEAIARGFSGTPVERAMAAMRWTAKHVVHPHLVEKVAADRAMTEEQLIDSARGWCNEQARVFIGLCQVMELPARLCFVFHDNLRSGHTCAEVYLDGRWVFFDVTFEVVVTLPDGRLAEGRDLSGPYRDLAHAAYRPSLTAYYARAQPFVENEPGWRSADRPTIDRGGDLLGFLGITNYLIEGVEPA